MRLRKKEREVFRGLEKREGRVRRYSEKGGKGEEVKGGEGVKGKERY